MDLPELPDHSAFGMYVSDVVYDDALDWFRDQMREYGKACYLQALEDVAQLGWTEIMRERGLVTWGDAATLGERVVDQLSALGEKK